MKNNHCLDCFHYQEYYFKLCDGMDGFRLTGTGYCYAKQACVKNSLACEQWKEKNPISLEKRKKIAYYAIIKTATILQELKEILETISENKQ